MSNIRPLATVAVLAAIAVFLVLEIQSGGNATLESGFGLEPAEIAMASDNGSATDGSAEAPPFYSEPELSLGQGGAPLAPPTFTDPAPQATPEAAMPLFAPQADEAPTDAADLPPLPELPPVDDLQGEPFPDQTPGAAMAGPATSLPAPAGQRQVGQAAPESVPMARYPDESGLNQPAPPQNTTPAPGAVSEAGSSQPASGPEFDSYTPSETTPLNFGAASPADPSEADWDNAQAALASGDLATAHRLLSKWRADERVAPPRRQEIDRLVSGLAGTLIYDSREHRLAPPHYVQPGETLQTIAKKYQVPWRLLAKINGVGSADAVKPGQSLKVVRGPFSAVVDEQAGEIVLMLGDAYAGRFPASVNLPTGAAGQLRVQSKNEGATPGLVLSGGGGSLTMGAGAGRYGAADVSLDASDAAEISDILSVGSLVTIRR
ncbi:MAG: LysM peptidoglycan-binding domain-containing protein [Planctomycetota bacterium]